ncbi:MAG: hypothetical protein ACD_73C00604G0001 [uncultured bacterium]|nr:MAG: hypothetical protein ACD_73C00604G0001 [uncultured bacterium]
MTRQNLQTLQDTLRRLLNRDATHNIRRILAKLHASDIAGVLHNFDSEFQDTLLVLLKDHSALPQIYSELGGDFVRSYLDRHGDFEGVANVLEKMPSDDRTTILSSLSEKQSIEILTRMSKEESAEVADLLEYKEDHAARILTTDVLKLNENTTIQEAIGALQKPSEDFAHYIYVVNDYEHLTGVVSIRQLFQFSAEKKLKDFMRRDIVRVGLTETQEEVARLVAQYDFVAIPVVDESSKLVGVITVDDIIDVIQDEAKENALKMGDAYAESLGESKLTEIIKQRVPWFLVLLLSGLFACEIINFFYKYLPPIGIFAGFIPVILRFGGIIARQTSTLVIENIKANPVTMMPIWKTFLNQAKVTLLIAMVSGGLAGFYALIRFSQFPLLAGAVSIALLSSMLIALLLGFVIPLLLSRLKLDPMWAAGSLVNFALDVVGLVIYFRVLLSMLHISL